MFQIYDGSTEFTQWDQGQKVTCDRMDAGDKVVFINFSGATYVMEAYAYSGVIVADVPNKLLQYASPIVIDLQDQPCQYTRIGVNASAKPDDYEFVDNTRVEKEEGPASGGGGGDCGVFIVTGTWNEAEEKMECSATFDEIVAAAGSKPVIYWEEGIPYMLCQWGENELGFAAHQFTRHTNADENGAAFTDFYSHNVITIRRDGSSYFHQSYR